MNLVVRELVVIGNAYLLAGIPVGGAYLAGRLSPLYKRERGWLLSCWSWMALTVVAAAWLVGLAGAAS